MTNTCQHEKNPKIVTIFTQTLLISFSFILSSLINYFLWLRWWRERLSLRLRLRLRERKRRREWESERSCPECEWWWWRELASLRFSSSNTDLNTLCTYTTTPTLKPLNHLYHQFERHPNNPSLSALPLPNSSQLSPLLEKWQFGLSAAVSHAEQLHSYWISLADVFRSCF